MITGYTLGDQILKYGGNTTLTINIQNTSDQMMKDIVMELGGLTAQQITVRNGMDVQRLVELAPGASSSFTYDLHADETVTDGTAILTATVSCGTASSGGRRRYFGRHGRRCFVRRIDGQDLRPLRRQAGGVFRRGRRRGLDPDPPGHH